MYSNRTSILSVLTMFFISKVSSFSQKLGFYRSISTALSSSTLYGYDFFASIGSPRFISAPMVDQSSLSWRLLVKQHGTDVAYSQMMHARNFVTDGKYRNDCIDWTNYTHISGDPSLAAYAQQLDSNLIVQLAGDDPNILIQAGKLVQNHENVAAIDLNLGCPQKIAKRGNYGAYLLQDTQLTIKLLDAMVKGLDVPVTAKIRRLSTDEATLDLCRRIEDVGVSMITIHGRTVDNAKLYITQADWDIIRKVKQIVHIPIIANGGISCYNDAIQCMQYTGADAVMSSEALLENPTLFNQQEDLHFQHNYITSQLRIVREYLHIVLSYPLPRPLFQVVRGHLFKFLFRFIDAPNNQDLRTILAEGNFEEMKSVVDIIEERVARIDYDVNIAEEIGLLNTKGKTWYMRHRSETSSLRVLSPRRVRSVVKLKSDEELEMEREMKMSELRKRLQERKSNVSSSESSAQRSTTTTTTTSTTTTSSN